MPPRILHLETCTIDLTRRQVDRDGVLTRLTGREAQLLGYLADRPGKTVSRD